MAVTKIKPIHSTLNAALDYITNKNKTCDSILIDSYGCSYMTAASEFSLTRSLNKSTVKGKKDVIAYHVIQSFKPDEIDYNLAHALGKEFAKKLTGGNFEYIIATHVDKNHIHNHIIFNSVSFCDHKKYHSNRQSYFNLRKLSDSLCMEYGLSVIENPQSKGQKYLQWMNKDRSFKTALRHNIDALLPFVASFEELLNSLKLQGYEIKETDNMLSFKAPVSNRFTRLSSLGPKYCKENLSLCIERHDFSDFNSVPSSSPSTVGLLSSLKDNIENGYSSHQIARYDLKRLNSTYLYLKEKKIDSLKRLSLVTKETDNNLSAVNKEIDNLLKEKENLLLLKKSADTFIALSPVYLGSKDDISIQLSNKPSDKIFLQAQNAISSSSYFTDGKPDFDALNFDLSDLDLKLQVLYKKQEDLSFDKKNLSDCKRNLESLFAEKNIPKER